MAKTETIVARRKAAKKQASSAGYVRSLIDSKDQSELRKLQTQVRQLNAQLNKILKRG